MSQENVEIARKAIEAWNVGDMARLRDLYDPDATYRVPSDWIEGELLVGREAVMKQFAAIREIWADASFDRVDMIDAGESVVVQVAFHGHTRGLPLTTEMAWVYTMRSGLIRSIEFFNSKAEALEAVGLPE